MKAGYQQTVLGALPVDWPVVALGELNPFITSGSRGWAEFYSEVGSPFIRITNMSRQSIHLDLADLKRVRLPPGNAEAARTELRTHDVLISITADVGIASYVDAALEKPAYVNQHISVVRLDPAKVSGMFVSYFLASERSQRRFRASTDQGAKAGMGLGEIRRIQIPLPSPAEQRAITAALGDIDDLIAALDQLIAKKRDIRQATAQQLLTGQRRPPGFTDNLVSHEQAAAGKAPPTWKVEALGTLGQWLSGGTPSMSDESCWNGDIPWVSPKDMKVARLHDAIDHVTAHALGNGTRLAPRGAVLMVVRGMILAHSFPVAHAERPLAFNQDIKALVVRSDVDSEFVLRWLQANGRQLLSHADESTHGTKRMSSATLFAAKVALPPLLEQRAIAAVLSDMDSELAALEARRAKTLALKQGMMQELLTGRTRLV